MLAPKRGRVQGPTQLIGFPRRSHECVTLGLFLQVLYCQPGCTLYCDYCIVGWLETGGPSQTLYTHKTLGNFSIGNASKSLNPWRGPGVGGEGFMILTCGNLSLERHNLYNYTYFCTFNAKYTRGAGAIGRLTEVTAGQSGWGGPLKIHSLFHNLGIEISNNKCGAEIHSKLMAQIQSSSNIFLPSIRTTVWVHWCPDTWRATQPRTKLRPNETHHYATLPSKKQNRSKGVISRHQGTHLWGKGCQNVSMGDCKNIQSCQVYCPRYNQGRLEGKTSPEIKITKQLLQKIDEQYSMTSISTLPLMCPPQPLGGG